MRIKQSLGERLFDLINILFMLLLCIVTLYPFIFVLFGSFSNPLKLMSHAGVLLHPLGFTFMPYQLIFKNPLIISGYRNTLIYLVLGTSISLTLTTLGGYVLSRKNLYWKNAFMIFIVITMFFSGGLVPLYLVVLKLKMINTLWAVILPGAVGTMYIIIMRTYFQGLPDALEESAKMDGANDWVVMIRIILPLSIPVLAVMALFYGVGYWNSWFYASVFLHSKELYPIQLVMRQLLITSSQDIATTANMDDPNALYRDTIKYAAIIIATGPIILAYPFLQKYFVKGVMIGSLKG